MNGLIKMDKKSDFILSAIHDAQSTIKSIDVKVAVLLTGMLVPISSLGKVWNHLINISSLTSNFVAILIGVLFLLLWLTAIFSLVTTLSAIDNPANHVVNSSEYNGVYYGGGLYQFGWLDVLLNRAVIKANKDVTSFSQTYPDNESDIVSELSFEHMKLIYIRELKLHRFKSSLKIAFVWLIIGITIYIYSKAG
jgi:hypothetical protein